MKINAITQRLKEPRLLLLTSTQVFNLDGYRQDMGTLEHRQRDEVDSGRYVDLCKDPLIMAQSEYSRSGGT